MATTLTTLGNAHALEKLSRFEADVDERVNKKILAIAEKADAEAKEILANAESDALSEAYEKIQTSVRKAESDYQKEITQNESDAHHAVLTHREEIVNKIFAELREKVIAFTKTGEYKDYLIRKLKEAEIPQSAVILIAEKDLSLKSQLQSVLPKADFQADNSIKIGGFSVKVGASVVNSTLDAALDEQRRSFSKNYKIA